MPDLGAFLTALPAPLLLCVVFLIVAAETGVLIGVLLPGASGLLVLGFLTTLNVVPFAAAVIVAALAAVAGGQLAYLTGRRYGAGKVPQIAQHRVNQLLGKHSGRGVLLAQWAVIARTLTPRMAGATGFTHRAFSLWHAPSASAWGATVTTAGHVAGATYERAGHAIGLAGLTALLVLVVLANRTRPAGPRRMAATAL